MSNIKTCPVCHNLFDADAWDGSRSGFDCPYCWKNSRRTQEQARPNDSDRWKRAALYLAGRLRTHADVVMKPIPDGMSMEIWRGVVAAQMHEDIDDGLSQIGRCSREELAAAHSGKSTTPDEPAKQEG